jgi:integrase
MASAWIQRRERGRVSYRVVYRLGGRESARRYAGSFPTKREARIRRDYIAGELAGGRVPDIAGVLAGPAPVVTLAAACDAWRASRVDWAESTRELNQVALARFLGPLGERDVASITADDVAGVIAELHRQGRKRSTIRHSLAALQQALDHAGRDPNPARDRRRVRLPHEAAEEVDPPTADHVERALVAVAPRYRLPVLVLEATAMRIGELVALRWRDVDEPEGRWRVHKVTAKTRRSRWVQVPPDLFSRVLALTPREDRDPDAPVFAGVGADRLRTDLARGCKAAGVPLFSPHDLRHRRLSLWHREGVPAAEAAKRAGHARSSVTLDTYSHVLVDDREVDARGVLD